MSIQQFLTISGLMIFSLANLSFNGSIINQQTSSYFNEAALIATGLGKSMLEEIHCKAFDEETINKAVNKESNLTAYNMMGYETGEGVSKYIGYKINHGYDASTTFDDIDDYNKFSRNYNSKLYDNFNVSVRVYYVDPLNPSVIILNQSFAKRVEITVTSPYLKISETDSIGLLKFNSIITY